MRTNLTIAIVLALTGLSSATTVTEYPPENAAVLYYRAMIQYEPEDDIRDKIADVATGNAKIDNEVLDHINQNRYVIDLLVDASSINKCNWGVDYSDGLETLMPHLSPIRDLGRLLLAESRSLCSGLSYELAIERCITAEKLSSHVNDRVLISVLVGASISALNDKCITHILADMPSDRERLLQIKNGLANYENRVDRMKTGLEGEKILATVHLNSRSPNRLTGQLFEQIAWNPEGKDEKKLKEELVKRIAKADEKFFNDAKKYWHDTLDSFIAAFEPPYDEAYEMNNTVIPEQFTKDAKQKPEALLASVFMPALGRVYSLSVKSQSSLDALKAAVEIYLVRARTGKLPENLPGGCPKDLFSGKDFVYEKTEEGFVLKCQGKDLSKDTVHEYAFKVKK